MHRMRLGKGSISHHILPAHICIATTRVNTSQQPSMDDDIKQKLITATTKRPLKWDMTWSATRSLSGRCRSGRHQCQGVVPNAKRIVYILVCCIF